MPQSMANITNALKDDYSPGLRNALNNMNVIWAEVSRNTEDIVGEQAVWSVHSGRSNSSGGRGELATLPTADRQRYLKPQDDLSFQYHTIKVSGPAKHLTRNNTGSFVRAVESEVKGAEKDLKRDLCRQTFGTKVSINSELVSGAIAQVSSVSSATVTFTETGAVIRHFHVGMQVGFMDDDAAFEPGIYEVQSIDPAAGTVTFTEALDAAVDADDFAFRVSGTTGASETVSSSNSSHDAEINGLRFLIADSTDDLDYAGVDAGNNPSWNAIGLGSSTTPISEVILDEAVEKVEVEGNGSSPGLYVAEHAQRRKLASMLQSQKRYDGRELTLTSGWRGLDVARGALVVDRFCPSDTVFALDMSEIELFVGLDFQWDEDDDGGVFYKALDGSDAIEARYKWYGNLEATVRNAHAKIALATPTF